MSHLDEPLGQQGSVGSTRRGYGIWLAAAVVVVVGAAGSALVWMNVGGRRRAGRRDPRRYW